MCRSDITRCAWVGPEPSYLDYHDTEWGVPQRDPRALWEQLVLEGFQAGLSWITILKKRAGFRAAFAGFQPDVVARWGAPEVERLLGDAGIVRHRGKIEATITNAQAFLRLEEGTGFAPFVWQSVDGVPLQPERQSIEDVPAQTEASALLSRRLKAAGFRFCGPTTVYAFMQAAGLVNDHTVDCFRYEEVRALGR